MASIRDYHRPGSVDEALALLNRSGMTSVLLGGGTTVVAEPGTQPVEVIDLQALPLGGLVADGPAVRIGATNRLQDVVDAEMVPELIRTAAKREAPNTIRNAATIGGAVAGSNWESGLLAALLVHAAHVELMSASGTATVSLPALLADRSQLTGCIITAVVVATGGRSGWAGTGRTPADTPIVAAYARRHEGATLLALTGVADVPLLIEPGDVGGLEPPGDFRGSAEYRKALATTLSSRVLVSLGVDG
ncbi:MAG TPA: FAD binding domain-containing protein [Acidimicrobiia bacterium]|jgi:CO/xanthine dehydrogenase FAD-binding subunit|nr:FAD binding domain-containing protein [Acidimicrobiia bacterium]